LFKGYLVKIRKLTLDMEKKVARKRQFVFWSYLKGLTKEDVDIRNIKKQSAVPKCKHCGSGNVVRYGYYSGIQRWWCKQCQRKFADNKAPPGMKTPEDQLAFALTMYYEGMGLKAIRRNLQQMYNSYPSDSTLYEWIERFTTKAIAADRKYMPAVGYVWVADETPLKIGSQNAWFWDILDIKTRFMLASHLSTRRTSNNARALMTRAVKKARKLPKVVVTNQLTSYIDGMELSLGTENERLTVRTPGTAAGAHLIERLHTALKARTKVVRGFKTIESARTIIRGWPVHYNYLRPYDVMKDDTPAQRAGIKHQLKIKIR
jgi:putative transposase